MRTTVELSDPVYRRLRAAAAERGLRGFSPLVEQALREYLDGAARREQISVRIKDAAGAWTERDATEWERTRHEVWATWRDTGSCAPMS